MVHVNKDDGSRVFIPYIGGLGKYVPACRKIADRDYAGFVLRDAEGKPHVSTESIAFALEAQTTPAIITE